MIRICRDDVVECIHIQPGPWLKPSSKTLTVFHCMALCVYILHIQQADMPAAARLQMHLAKTTCSMSIAPDLSLSCRIT